MCKIFGNTVPELVHAHGRNRSRRERTVNPQSLSGVNEKTGLYKLVRVLCLSRTVHFKNSWNGFKYLSGVKHKKIVSC